MELAEKRVEDALGCGGDLVADEPVLVVVEVVECLVGDFLERGEGAVDDVEFLHLVVAAVLEEHLVGVVALVDEVEQGDVAVGVLEDVFEAAGDHLREAVA